MTRVKLYLIQKKNLDLKISVEFTMLQKELKVIYTNKTEGTSHSFTLGREQSDIYKKFKDRPIETAKIYYPIFLKKYFDPDINFLITDTEIKGGKREGSGRKKESREMHKTTVNIDKELYDFVKNMSSNTFSKNLEYLIRGYTNDRGKDGS